MSALKVVKTDTLVVEYVELPMNDIHYGFVYRFMEPVPTVWNIGKMSLYESLSYTEAKELKAHLSTFFLSKWKEMLPPDLQPPLGWENEDYIWLYDINKTLLLKCEIKRTN